MVQSFLDKYVWIARIAPATICLLPLVLCFLAWVEGATKYVEPIVSLPVFTVLLVVLEHLARDLGKRKESALFESWGGQPSATLLRTTNEVLNPHTKLQALLKASSLTGLSIPTAEDEVQNQRAADHIYESYSTTMKEKVRDSVKGPLLLAENISYGFRRNLYGLKPIGLGLALASTGAILWRVLDTGGEDSASKALPHIAFALALALTAFLVFVVKPSWVRSAAQNYSLRLVESFVNLEDARK